MMKSQEMDTQRPMINDGRLMISLYRNWAFFQHVSNETTFVQDSQRKHVI